MDFACDMMPPLISLEALCVILDANRPVPASSQFPNSHSNNNVNDKTFLIAYTMETTVDNARKLQSPSHGTEP